MQIVLLLVPVHIFSVLNRHSSIYWIFGISTRDDDDEEKR
jgi:hypothetical protein